jgi:hypothetical protein
MYDIISFFILAYRISLRVIVYRDDVVLSVDLFTLLENQGAPCLLGSARHCDYYCY